MEPKQSFKVFIMDNTFPVGSCPVCKTEFYDWDEYLEHLVNEKRKILKPILDAMSGL